MRFTGQSIPTWLTAVVYHVAALVFFALSYVLFHPPLWANWNQAYMGGVREDPGIYVWLMHYNVKNVLTLPSEGFDIGTFYPFGRALAFSDNFLLPSAIAKFPLALGANPVAVYNSILILAAALNGYACAMLAYYVCGSRACGCYAGLVFMNLPFFVSQMGHPQLQFVFGVPFAILSVLTALEMRSIVRASLVGCAVLACFLTSVYYALYCILAVAITVLAWCLLRPSRLLLRDLFFLVTANAPWVAALVLLAEPYRQVRKVFGARDLSWGDQFSMKVWSYFASPGWSWLWKGSTVSLSNYEGYLYFSLCAALLSLLGFVSSLYLTGAPTTKLRILRVLRYSVLGQLAVLLSLAGVQYPGQQLIDGEYSKLIVQMLSLLMLLLGMGTLWSLGSLRQCSSAREVLSNTIFRGRVGSPERRWVFYRDRAGEVEFPLVLTEREKAGVIWFLGVAFLVLSFGSTVSTNSPWHSLSPYAWLYYYAPGFDALRVPARMGIIVALAFCVLAAMGVGQLRLLAMRVHPVFSRGGTIIGLSILFCIISGVELFAYYFPLVADIERPKIFNDLPATDEEYDALACLPFGSLGDSGARYAFLQTSCMQNARDTNYKLLNGYSGVITNYHIQLRDQTVEFPDSESLDLLRRTIGLRYIAYLGELVDKRERAQVERNFLNMTDELTLISKDELGNALFAFHPVLRGPKLEIYAPPDTTGERKLTFEMRRLPEYKEDRLTVNIILGPVKVKKDDTVSSGGRSQKMRLRALQLPRAKDEAKLEWKKFSVTLPPTIGSVKPHAIKLFVVESNASDAFELRNFNLRSLKK